MKKKSFLSEIFCKVLLSATIMPVITAGSFTVSAQTSLDSDPSSFSSNCKTVPSFWNLKFGLTVKETEKILGKKLRLFTYDSVLQTTKTGKEDTSPIPAFYKGILYSITVRYPVESSKFKDFEDFKNQMLRHTEVTGETRAVWGNSDYENSTVKCKNYDFSIDKSYNIYSAQLMNTEVLDQISKHAADNLNQPTNKSQTGKFRRKGNVQNKKTSPRKNQNRNL